MCFKADIQINTMILLTSPHTQNLMKKQSGKGKPADREHVIAWALEKTLPLNRARTEILKARKPCRTQGSQKTFNSSTWPRRTCWSHCKNIPTVTWTRLWGLACPWPPVESPRKQRELLRGSIWPCHPQIQAGGKCDLAQLRLVWGF